MKKLEKILQSVNILNTVDLNDVQINGITMDSRQVKEGFLFIAYKGTHSNGHDYIASAVEKGAHVIVLDDPSYIEESSAKFVQVQDARQLTSELASRFYDHPSKQLKVVGITGTNGKTTVATLLHELYQALGFTTGLISTIKIKFGDTEVPAKLTTPDPISLQAMFAEMVDAGLSHVFMEVSSHALDQGRVAAVDFDAALFTNLSHDHLDYHKTFQNYLKAKKKLFDGLKEEAVAITNIDDKNGRIMIQNCKASSFGYALKRPTDFKSKMIANDIAGLHLEIGETEIFLKLVGFFNAYNATLAFAFAIVDGLEKSKVLQAISQLSSADGRMDIIRTQEAGYTAVVDYAHTPDALSKVLETIQNIKKPNQNIITVVGCGGNRDKEKRPKMAAIGAQYSNKLILTSDNPRDEDPEDILSDMMAGMTDDEINKSLKITDRKEAIKMACMLAQDGDIILVAGKGHETYQEIKGQRFPFDDKKILNAFMH
ncbi:MAG: UDP-N-acetylmuramoyl-L-alanyl-D-glutamate--2,6-diaminopimelate ligase [Saprospiraceae bacterium]|nr:UDP-N-acetylmuramoyl-L-alanyl-D-glutamate--2,6-diaminopimelate ligase [Saprospiraceae bacterium]